MDLIRVDAMATGTTSARSMKVDDPLEDFARRDIALNAAT